MQNWVSGRFWCPVVDAHVDACRLVRTKQADPTELATPLGSTSPGWYPLPSSPAATPAKAPATGNMAAAVIYAHATLLSSAVVDFMDIYKSWACPWAPL